jgi:hypothetical protein
MAWYPDPYAFDYKNVVRPLALDASYVLRGLKTPMVWSVATLVTFTATECVLEQLRSTNTSAQSAPSYLNAMGAGCMTGLVMGSMHPSKRLDIMASTALCMGIVMGLVELNGQTVVSDTKQARTKWHLLPPAATEKPSFGTGTLPMRHVESSALAKLKQIYPEYKDL